MRRLRILLLFAAWLCASGVQWDALQLVAWGKMFTQYAQNQSFTQAFKSTMENRCEMCVAVADGRAQQDESPAIEGKAAAKWLVTLERAEAVPFFPVVERLIQAEVEWSTSLRPAPALQPPRLG